MTAVLFICTGNAARSVMAGVALRELRPDVSVDTAGTMVVDGTPLSWRTRAALDAVGLPLPRHVSQQATQAHLAVADVVVAMAPEHVTWVSRQHPSALSKTATLRHLVDALPPTSRGPDTVLAQRLSALDLAHRPLDLAEEITAPGGGEVDAFVACAQEVLVMVQKLAVIL